MGTPERIYMEVLNGEITPRWAPNREDKTDVEYVRADLHEALRADLIKPLREPCKGTNCGCMNGIDHSPECEAEQAASAELLQPREEERALLRAALAEGFGYVVGTDEVDGIIAITVSECDAELIACAYPCALPILALADILEEKA
jgi:hypothetical protein